MNHVAQTTGDSADTKRDSQPGSRLFLGSCSLGSGSVGSGAIRRTLTGCLLLTKGY
jgi:hypothetical protein